MLFRSPLDRHLHAFVWLPRDAMSTTIRLQVQAMLTDAADASVIDWALEITANLAMMRFALDIDDDAPTPDEAELDQVFAAMVRGWPAAVEAELADCDAPIPRGRAGRALRRGVSARVPHRLRPG